MLICGVCGKLNAVTSRNCDLCGAPLAPDGREAAPPAAQPEPQPTASQPLSGPICPVCRRSNRSISVFCAYCGYRLRPANGPLPYALPHNGAQAHGGVQPPLTIASDEAGNIPSGTMLKKRYRIVRKIAQGGMGAVYECTDTHAPAGTRWAIKEMSPAALPVAERTQAIADFRREAQMLASLQHHNLPTVVETFEQFGKHFLVMEFVAGRTLQNMIDSTPGFIAEERIRVWARQLFDVIGYLHSQNPPIIYRDLKPANIMLLEGTERTKLIDFGIARFHKAGKSRDTEAFGTAGYAPPEQYGKGQTDQRSDVYALAAALHYLITKHDPGLNPFNWLPVRQYNPSASQQMEAALQRALNLDPQRRFASIGEFASALGMDLPVYARPVEVTTPPVTIHHAPEPIAAPAAAPVASAPAPAPAQTQRSQRQRGGSQKSSQPKSQAKQKPQPAPAAPVAAPIPVPVPVVPAASIAPAATVAATVAATATATGLATAPAPVASPVAPVEPAPVPRPTPTPPVTFSPSVPPGDTATVDRGTTSTASPSSRIGSTPSLVVSDKVVDLGEARWNTRAPARKIRLMNVGGGEMKGTVQATQPWVALNVQSFRGNAQTIEVRVRKRQLRLGRVELHVPNLFAIIWARTRWALPFIGFWLWVLLLMASSLGRWMLFGLIGLVGAVLFAEVLMWWWALHVRLLVPAERLNSGRLLVKSSGGEQQIEVKVRARPSPVRKAFGWTLAAALLFVELGAVIWTLMTVAGYPVAIPGLM